MKILFDCTYLRNKQTGVDVTFFSLLESLIKIDTVNEYIIVIDHRFKASFIEDKINGLSNFTVKKIYCFYPLHILISAFIVPFYLWALQIDVYHNPYFFGPRFKLSKVKIVITVHDLYYKTIPEKMNNSVFGFFMKHFSDPAINLADKIIVISTQTKTDFEKFYNVPQSKIDLIYQCISEATVSTDAVGIDILKANVLKENEYILTVGTISASKGIDDLIQGYNTFINEHKDLMKIKLVFAGKFVHQYGQSMLTLVKELGMLDGNIVFLGYVADHDLINLYRGALVYVSPSYYEGFGLTVLEAMKYKCPVIVRNASSLPEVVGDAGLLFDTIEQLSTQIHQLTTDVVIRAKLIANGQKQRAKFSCEARAIKTLNTYVN